jgi:hypothetical protein
MNAEYYRVDEQYRLTSSRRNMQYRVCDCLDYLELIQLRDRWEYFQELDAIIDNIIFDRWRRRPPWRPLGK